MPTTFLLTSFYWDNLIHFGMGPKKGPDGKLAITFPMGDRKLPGIAAEDIGKCAYSIFKKGPEFIGKTVGIAGEHLTGAQMAAALTRAIGAGGALQRRLPRSVPGLRVPGRRRPRQHVPVQARLQGRLLRGARHRRRAVPQSLPADVRGLACRDQEPDPDRKGIPARSGRMTEAIPRQLYRGGGAKVLGQFMKTV